MSAPKRKARHQPSKPWMKAIRLRRREVVILGAVAIVAVAVLMYYCVPFTTDETRDNAIIYKTLYIQDSSLELGQQQVRQNGQNGTTETVVGVRHTLSGRNLGESVVSERVVTQPANETVAKGTKKYQYMWCSNGSYQYYTNEQFKDPNTGFTHQSPDYCTRNGQGQMTGLADTPPATQPSSPSNADCTFNTNPFTGSVESAYCTGY